MKCNGNVQRVRNNLSVFIILPFRFICFKSCRNNFHCRSREWACSYESILHQCILSGCCEGPRLSACVLTYLA